MKNVDRIATHAKSCDYVKDQLQNLGWYPESSLAEAKSRQSVLMESYTGTIECPTPTETVWKDLGSDSWWLPVSYDREFSYTYWCYTTMNLGPGSVPLIQINPCADSQTVSSSHIDIGGSMCTATINLGPGLGPITNVVPIIHKTPCASMLGAESVPDSSTLGLYHTSDTSMCTVTINMGLGVPSMIHTMPCASMRGAERGLEAIQAPTLFSTTTTALPGPQPSNPPKHTTTSVRTNATPSTSISVDLEGVAHGIVQGRWAHTVLRTSSRRRESTVNTTHTAGGHAVQKKHFLQGPPQRLRSTPVDLQEQLAHNMRRKISVVEIRQMLSSAADLQLSQQVGNEEAKKWRDSGLS